MKTKKKKPKMANKKKKLNKYPNYLKTKHIKYDIE